MKDGRLKVLTESGVLIAAALALSQFKLFVMPSGGSVSLSALPILILSARHGLKTGVLAGLLAGFLSAVFKPVIVHPLQFILEYPLAHAMLGISGVFVWNNWKKAVFGTVVAQSLKLVCHVIAGAVFFMKGDGAITDALIASSVYNVSYILPETIISCIIVSYVCLNNSYLVARVANDKAVDHD